jgi:uncharacterized protein (DUF2235 family)
MKNIVLLSDGTGNSAGKLARTNVWRLYEALDLRDETKQVAYYDDGVGTSSFKPIALLGGAVGLGLRRNVIDLYTFLCRNYEPGDRIYCFGFSRGAFTIRLLTGVVNSQGIVRAATDDALRDEAARAFSRFRNVGKHLRHQARKVGRQIQRVAGREPPEKERGWATDAPPIEFVGLWDTVSAYGLPVDELTRAWSVLFPLGVADRDPCPIVKRACHALALDDERRSFHPVLWNEAKLPPQHRADATHIDQEIITQVWFAGAHADVGGGYSENQLSHLSLDWMMQQASGRGLLIVPEARQRVKEGMNVNGMLHDPRAGVGGAYRYLPRDLRKLCKDTSDPDNQVVIARPKIHESVFRRIRHSDDAYAPIVLPENYAVVDAKGSILRMPEVETEAKERIRRQEGVWELVWQKNVIYFGSVLAALALAAFPFLFRTTQACREALCGISWPIGVAAQWLPDFLEPWLTAYENRPWRFYLLLLALVFFVWMGGRWQELIRAEMRAIWLGKPSPRPVRRWSLLAPIWRPLEALWAKAMVPVTTIAVIVLLVAGASQFVFGLTNSFGYSCEGAASGLFRASDFCFRTGVRVARGVKYQVRIEYEAPFASLRAASWPLVPFRRHMGEPWLVPVARIGTEGTDEYPLPRADILVAGRTVRIAEITARRSGELYLFPNGVVFPWVYGDNTGSAKVTVVPVRSWPPAASIPLL